MYSEKKKREEYDKIVARMVDSVLYSLEKQRYFLPMESYQLAYYDNDGKIISFDDYLINKGIINNRNQLNKIILEEKRIFGYTKENCFLQKEFFSKDGWEKFGPFLNYSDWDCYKNSMPKDGWKSLLPGYVNMDQYRYPRPEGNIYYKITSYVEPLTGQTVLALGNFTGYDSFPGRSTTIVKTDDYLGDHQIVGVSNFGDVYGNIDINKIVKELDIFIPLVNASLLKINEAKNLESDEKTKVKQLSEQIASKYNLK